MVRTQSLEIYWWGSGVILRALSCIGYLVEGWKNSAQLYKWNGKMLVTDFEPDSVVFL